MTKPHTTSFVTTDTEITVAIVSDLHLEGMTDAQQDLVTQILAEAFDGVDMVLLDGDIDIGTKSIEWAADTFPSSRVYQTAGNHTGEGMVWSEMPEQMHESAARTRNVTFLENETATTKIRGREVRVHGCTYWTDYALYGEAKQAIAMMNASGSVGLRDFQTIYEKPGQLARPQFFLDMHKESRTWLDGALSDMWPREGLTFVMTHHAPSDLCLDPRYFNDALNPAFASNHTNMVAYSDATLWNFGHTHYNLGEKVGNTLLYGYQTARHILNPVNGSEKYYSYPPVLRF